MAARSARLSLRSSTRRKARDHGGEAEFAASDSYRGRHDNHAWCRKFESALHHRTEILQPCGISALGMARPGLEPGTPRFSVLTPNLSNQGKSPAIKRLLVGSVKEAEVSYLRTFALQLGTQIGLVPNRRRWPRRRPVNARPVSDSTAEPPPHRAVRQ